MIFEDFFMLDQRFALLLLVALIFSGCASHGGYRPTVDPYGDPRADRIGQDLYECDGLAYHASRVEEASVGGAIVGGGIGMMWGALLGGIHGNPVQGAMMGATVGGLAGGVSQGANADQRFVHAYRNCMVNRGHNVID
jgi:outer membrane lipoprotein SlyB